MNSQKSNLKKRFSMSGKMKIYRTFKALDIDEESEVEFRIQDLPKDRLKDAIKFIEVGLLKNGSEIADKVFLNMMRKTMKNGSLVACFKENSDEIIALNILTVKDEKEYKDELDFPKKPFKDIFGIISYANMDLNPFKHYNIEHIMYAIAIGVKLENKGRDIAYQMFECRQLICKAFGLNLMTILNTEFEEKYSIKKSEVHEINTKLILPNTDVVVCLRMYLMLLKIQKKCIDSFSLNYHIKDDE